MGSLHRRGLGVGVGVLLCLGCQPEEPPGFSQSPGGDLESLAWGDEVLCEPSDDGFVRFEEEAVQRGLGGLGVGGDEVGGAGLVVRDLDADTDLDLVFIPANHRPPTLFVNDGSGHFTAHPGSESLAENRGNGLITDLDGDGSLEFLLGQPTSILITPNPLDEEGSESADPTAYQRLDLSNQEGHVHQLLSFAVGDLDGDRDLDLVVGTGFSIPLPPDFDPENPGKGPPDVNPEDLTIAPDLWYRNDGGTFVRQELEPMGSDKLGQLMLMTDRDNDGDLDVLVASDLGRLMGIGNAFFRNDGPGAGGPVLVDDAPTTGTDVAMSAMGAAGGDLNGDGEMDYVMSDLGPPRAFLSSPSGSYVDAAQALGLVPEGVDRPDWWSGWSVEMNDLDNDGLLDVVIAGGTPGINENEDLAPDGEEEDDSDAPPDPSLLDHPDVIFQGLEDGTFADRSAQIDFGSAVDHRGMVTADFDGDGALDILLASTSGGISYWSNQCTPGNWVRVELAGRVENRDAFGARVELTAGDRTWLSEVHSLRTDGQGPPRLHFGLGGAEVVDELVIRWPDGPVTSGRLLPVRRTITARHPEL
ncbi:MAG: CRTAC1 family protein [Myxococcota bacterium]|nr:CRTAC1 family protein [Myxococcota bacterium]